MGAANKAVSSVTRLLVRSADFSSNSYSSKTVKIAVVLRIFYFCKEPLN